MDKYSIDLKLALIKKVLEGNAKMSHVARENGVGVNSLQRWVAFYRKHGMESLKTEKSKFTSEFKKHVLEYMYANNLSYFQTAVHFNISSDSTIGQWDRQYRIFGSSGYCERISEYKGSKFMKNTEIKNFEEKLQNESDLKTDKQLLEELQYLRAENAYLKKLSALIRKEEKSIEDNK